MVDLTTSHVTRYSYWRPVSLNPHRLILGPRDGRLLRVCAFDLSIAPLARVAWTNDVFGTVVEIASFDDATTELSIESRIELVHFLMSQFLIASPRHSAGHKPRRGGREN